NVTCTLPRPTSLPYPTLFRSRAAEARHLRHDPFLPAAVSGSVAPRRTLGRGAGDHWNHLRRARFDGAAQPEKTGGVFFSQPPWLRGARYLRVPEHFHAGRCFPDARARDFDRRAVLSRRHALRPAAYL